MSKGNSEQSEHNEKKKSGGGSGGIFGLGNSQVFLVVLAALFVLGAIQALQFSGAINAVSQLNLGGAGNAALVQQSAPVAAAGNAGAQQATPSNLQNLPDMVGGC